VLGERERSDGIGGSRRWVGVFEVRVAGPKCGKQWAGGLDCTEGSEGGPREKCNGGEDAKRG
jgi:hypothetical protein